MLLAITLVDGPVLRMVVSTRIQDCNSLFAVTDSLLYMPVEVCIHRRLLLEG